jgi:hypothetical protein
MFHCTEQTVIMAISGSTSGEASFAHSMPTICKHLTAAPERILIVICIVDIL